MKEIQGKEYDIDTMRNIIEDCKESIYLKCEEVFKNGFDKTELELLKEDIKEYMQIITYLKTYL